MIISKDQNIIKKLLLKKFKKKGYQKNEILNRNIKVIMP